MKFEMRTEDLTPVLEASRPWNLRTGEPRLSSRLAEKMERVKDFLPQERFTEALKERAKLTASLSRKKIEDLRTGSVFVRSNLIHCPGMLVSERMVDSHMVSKSAENEKVLEV